MKDASIMIGGDLCPINGIEELFIKGNIEEIYDGFLVDFKSSDLSIVNLECPLIEKETPIKKNGPVLGAPSGSIKGIADAGIRLVSLANNHILDHGEEGLKNTLQVCHENGIEAIGAGKDLHESGTLLIKAINGIRVAFYACAEHEFSIATKTTYGANPIDLIHYVQTLQENQGNYDFLIVLYHGGVEWYSYPTPEMIRRCRFMVDMGACAVICSHTHCPVSYEEYNNGLIVYGVGNLIFRNSRPIPHSWHEGFLVKLSFAKGRDLTYEFLPYVQGKEGMGLRKLTKKEEAVFWEGLNGRSKETTDIGLIENKWRNHCQSKKQYYLNSLFAYNRIIRGLNRFAPIAKRLHPEKMKLHAYNMMQCESHRETLLTILDDLTKK